MTEPEVPEEETEVPEEEPVKMINSYLWKSSQLIHNSGYFSRLVEAAAWKKSKEYTPELLRYVASTEPILDAIDLPVGEGIDAALMQLVFENGPMVDEAIEHMVETWEPGALPPTNPDPPVE